MEELGETPLAPPIASIALAGTSGDEGGGSKSVSENNATHSAAPWVGGGGGFVQKFDDLGNKISPWRDPANWYVKYCR